MTFKRHAMGRIEDRPVSEQFEAKFHQLLCPQLDRCVNMGNKKKQGYIMGAFREALADFRVLSPEQRAKMTEFTREEASAIYDMVAKRQQVALDCEKSSTNPELIRNHRETAQMMSAIKVKMMVLMLMEVENDVPGV